MKKGLFLFISLSLSCFLYAQETNTLTLPPELPSDLPVSIKESDDYKLAERYREMAIEAHNAGDYNQSIEYARQSKEYSDKIILRYGVYEYVLNSQRDAERKLSLFKGLGGDTNQLTTSLYEESVTDINSANTMLESATNSNDYTNTMLEYNKSAEKSELGYNVLSIDLRRDYLINESVLTNGDNNDTQITTLRDESKELLGNGDYTNSLTKSRDAMNILDMLEAPLAYAKAQEAMDKAKQDGFNNSKPNMYNEASKSLSSAGETLVANNYSDSLMHSKNVISLVNSMESTSEDTAVAEEEQQQQQTVVVSDGTVFPQYYIVQSRRANTDSLWRIASYDFIYGNGNLWRKIYEANRDTIRDPNVIRSGQRLIIPSLKGETREGTYDTNQTYGNITTFSTNQIEGNIVIEDEQALDAQNEETEQSVVDEQVDNVPDPEMTEDTAATTDENAEMTDDAAATDENTEMADDAAATDENTEMTDDAAANENAN